MSTSSRVKRSNSSELRQDWWGEMEEEGRGSQHRGREEGKEETDVHRHTPGRGRT